MKRKTKISQEARNVSVEKVASTTLHSCIHQRISPAFASDAQRMGKLLDVPIHRMMDELSAATAISLHQAYVEHHEQYPFLTFS